MADAAAYVGLDELASLLGIEQSRAETLVRESGLRGVVRLAPGDLRVPAVLVADLQERLRGGGPQLG